MSAMCNARKPGPRWVVCESKKGHRGPHQHHGEPAWRDEKPVYQGDIVDLLAFYNKTWRKL